MLRRLVKIALIILGGLVFLVVAASLSLHILIQRQDHQFIKDQVARRVAEATGYTLQINGALEFPYSLQPTVVFNDIVLNAVERDGDADLLAADEFRITIAILPLLNDRLRIDDTTLTNARLRLEFDAAGQPNWIPESPPDTDTSDTAVEVHAINFRQLQIQLVDRRIDVELGAQIEELNARIAELRLDAPVDETFVDVELVAEFEEMPIRAEGRISARDNAFAGLELPVSLTGSILDMAFTLDGHIDRVVGAPIDEVGFFAKVHLEGSDMDAFSEVTGLPLPTTTSFVIDGDVEGHPGSIVASGIVGRLQQGALTLAATGRIGQLTSFDELTLDATVAGADLQEVPYFPPDWLRATDSFDVSARVSGDWPALRLDNLSASARRNDITVTASGRLADASTFGGADLNIGLDGNDIADLAILFDMDSVNTRSFSWSGRVLGSWPQLSIEKSEFNVERDDLKARVTGGYRDIINSPKLDIRLEAEGGDLAAVPELETLELPMTDDFSFTVELSGEPTRPSARNATAKARRGRHEVTLSGAIADLGSLSGIEIYVSARGTDLAEINDVFTPDFPATEHYALTSRLSGDIDSLSASDLKLEGSAPGLDLEMSGAIGTIVELRDVDVQSEVSIDDPSEFGRWSGVSLPGDIKIELSGHMAGTAPRFELSDMTYSSGESLVHGNVTMLVGDKLSFAGAVTSGQLDLRPFFDAAEDESSTAGDQERSRLFSDEPFDLSWLDAVDLDFSLDNLELVRTGEFTRVRRAHISLEQGTLKIDPLEMTYEDAKLSGHVHLDRDALPALDANLSAENIDLARFLEDIRFHDYYDGSFDMALQVSTRGSSLAEMAAGLDGELAIFISDASVSGVEAKLRITDVLLGALPWLKQEDDVYINCAMSQMVSDDGIVDVPMLYVDSRQLRMIGGGTIDLRNETYDMRLQPRPRGTRIFAHNIDLLLTGSITDPEYSTTGAAKTVATKYGKFVLLGPAGLFIPTGKSQKHPCAGSLQEYREAQVTSESEQ